MKYRLIALLTFLLSALSYADEAAIKKYRNYTPEQIQQLPKELLNSSVPIGYTLAARRGLSIGSDLLFAMDLNRLMYPGLHDFDAAVKAFQIDLGDQPTGTLTVWQIFNLQQRSDMQKLARVLFPDSFYNTISPDYANISGTLIIVDDQIAWPINHVDMKCFKKLGQCELHQIHIVVPDDESWSQNFNVIMDSTVYYDITRWTEDSVDAVATMITQKR